jgi:hypothetical protein
MNQLLDEYVCATEINLATLSELCGIKSSSKCRIDRQKSICLKMLQVCQEYASEIKWHGYDGFNVGHKGVCPRVKKMLTADVPLGESLDQYISYCKGL